MEHKIGDKVTIRSLEWYNKNKDEDGKVAAGSQSFVKDMSKYCGMQATIISDYGYGCYLIDIDKSQWSWTDEMFEEQLEKQTFKPFDRIIIKPKVDYGIWYCDLFSYYCQEDNNYFFTIGGNKEGYGFEDVDILHYAGNEYLVGTSDMPEEEVELKEGELVFAFDTIDNFEEYMMVLRKFLGIYEDTIIGNSMHWKYCLPFSKFNHNDLEETKKHILCVKNGKLVKYKED